MLRRLILLIGVCIALMYSDSALGSARFQGSWIGDWSGGGQKGRLYATISLAGTATGYVLNTTAGDWGELNGSVSPSGDISFAISYTSIPVQNWTGKVTSSLQNLKLNARPVGAVSRIYSTLRPDPFRGAEVAPENSTGTWSGSWSGGGRHGSAEITVLSTGRAEGVVTASDGESGIVDGQLTPQGDFFGVIQYPSGATDPFVSKFIPGRLRMTAPYTQRRHGTTVVRGTFTLVSGPLPLSNDSRSVGTWTGSWRNGSDAGTMTIVVRANGMLTGTLLSARTRMTGNITGQVTGIGNFFVDVTVVSPAPGSPARFELDGTMALAGSRLNGTFVGASSPGNFSLQRRP